MKEKATDAANRVKEQAAKVSKLEARVASEAMALIGEKSSL